MHRKLRSYSGCTINFTVYFTSGEQAVVGARDPCLCILYWKINYGNDNKHVKSTQTRRRKKCINILVSVWCALSNSAAFGAIGRIFQPSSRYVHVVHTCSTIEYKIESWKIRHNSVWCIFISVTTNHSPRKSFKLFIWWRWKCKCPIICAQNATKRLNIDPQSVIEWFRVLVI